MERQNAISVERPSTFVIPVWIEVVLVSGLIILAGLAQGYNMFHYPTLSRHNDEGIYIQQAWSVLRMGKLSPYTYWFDHAPAGWILLAIWMGITGGPNTFGASLDSGRVFMLLLHLSMVPMLYYLARKLKISVPLSAFAVFLFALTPMAIRFQRLVLLDNIMMFWLLASFCLLMPGRFWWGRVVLSGLTFGLAALSKEPAIFMLPVVLLLLYQHSKGNTGIAVVSWGVAAAFVIGLYPLWAAMHGQLFPVKVAGGQPTEVFPSGSINLLEALKWQASRTGGGMFWEQLRVNWLPQAPFLILFGMIAIVANLGRGLRNGNALAVGLMGFLPLFYMARGGIVYDFYIIFAIPFLALNVAMLFDWMFNLYLPQPAVALLTGWLASILILFYLFTGRALPLYQSAADMPYRQGLAWIKSNIDPNSRMVIPDNIWTDLHEPGNGKPPFVNAHSYWKVNDDPLIKNNTFQGDWRNVDYVILTPEMLLDLKNSNNTLVLEALNHSTQVQHWEYGPSSLQVLKINVK